MSDKPEDAETSSLKSQDEASDQDNEKPIEDVCTNMLEKVFEYFNGELTG